jgi:hypothetical protein
MPMKKKDPEEYLLSFMETKQSEYEYESEKLNLMNMVIFQNWDTVMALKVNNKMHIEVYAAEDRSLVITATIERIQELSYHVEVTRTCILDGRSVNDSVQGWLNTTCS